MKIEMEPFRLHALVTFVISISMLFLNLTSVIISSIVLTKIRIQNGKQILLF